MKYIFIIALIINLSNAHALTLYKGHINAQYVEAHNKPTSDSKVKFTLKKDQQVTIQSIAKDNWYKISLPFSNKYAYIESKYITITETVKLNNSCSIDLKITNVDLNCEEDIAYGGYNACNIDTYITIRAKCNDTVSPLFPEYRKVECEHDLKYRNFNDNYIKSTTYRSYDSIDVYDGIIDVYISGIWTPSVRDKIERVVHVKKSSTHCTVSN